MVNIAERDPITEENMFQHNLQPAYLLDLWADLLAHHGIYPEDLVPVVGGPTARTRLDPSPHPWRVPVAQLLRAAQAKDLAMQLPEGQQKAALKSAGAAIDSILDDWCGTPPKFPYPWPWPGPPPWVWEIASELSLVANSLQPGSLRDVIQDVSLQALQKANLER
jgi:hypothetical protein